MLFRFQLIFHIRKKKKKNKIMEGKRARGKSGHESELYKGEISVEDLTVMKLMEEIMEFDQEIKMK